MNEPRDYNVLDDSGTIIGLDYDAYITDALRTEKPKTEIVGDKALAIAILKIAVATGALIDILKKGVVYGKELSADTIEQKLDAVGHELDDGYNALYGEDNGDVQLAVNPRLLHAALGAFGEEAEFLELLLKGIEANEVGAVTVKELVDETGDTKWYGALRDDVLRQHGVFPSNTLAGNIAKLDLRHQGKALTLESSENKNRAAELAAVSAALAPAEN
jgi:hypothetical protein